MYVLRESDCLTIIAIWVDDGLIYSNSEKKLDGFVTFLAEHFEMSCGPVGCFVGIQITRNESSNSICLSQKNSLERLLKKFNLSECHIHAFPADPFTHLSKSLGRDSSREKHSNLANTYREAVGSLIYAVTCTRTDIAYAVG